MKVHFTGIGGKGMSSIAQFMKKQGHTVTGSDRYYDQGTQLPIFEKLQSLGIKIFPQNGSGVTKSVDKLIISSAIEENNSELQRAIELGIPVLKRAIMLAEIFNSGKNSIAVGGTSGKTTVSGMITTILYHAGLNPTSLLGGELINHYQSQFSGNLVVGNDNYLCIEADESDGTITYYRPEIGVITNISKDHQEVEDLLPLFQKYINNMKGTLIINGDCPVCARLSFPNKAITFGFSEKCMVRAQEVTTGSGEVNFKVNGIPFKVKQWGRHSVENALAAISAASALGIKMETISQGLSCFKGMKRRLEQIGQHNGISYFDDYAHNPKKIEASILALNEHFHRLILILQCHGFQPTSFMWDELVTAFISTFRQQDILMLLPIYDAGGSTNRNVSAKCLAEELVRKGINTNYCAERKDCMANVSKIIAPGDAVLVMGARDESLSQFARDLIKYNS